MILVTGGAGFIGSNLVRALSGDQGQTVRVLDDLSTGLDSNLADLDVDFIAGSVTDSQTLTRSMSDVTAVVHLAARGAVPRSISDPLATHHVNDFGSLQVLEAARRVKAQVILASSSSVYGANSLVPKRELQWTQPLSPYGASKLAAEGYALAYRHVYGLDVLVLRFFNVYGPLQRPDHDYAAVVPRFVSAALTGRSIEIHGDGLQSRDFTHVRSIVGVLSAAVLRRVTHETPVNVAFGTSATVLEVADEIERQVGRPLVRRFAPARAGDIRQSSNDPSLLLRLFPEASATPLSVGIASVVEWLSRD